MFRLPHAVALACIAFACEGGEPVGPGPAPPPPTVVPPPTVLVALWVSVEYMDATLAGLELRDLHLQVRRSTGMLAKDTVVAIPPDTAAMTVAVTVALASPRERFEVRVALAGPDGDTLFRAGPDTVDVEAGRASTLFTSPAYVGPGHDAARVIAVPGDTALTLGDTADLSAVVLDPSGQPMLGTPRIWSSLDPETVVLVDRPGRVTTSALGLGRVRVRLLTGQADTVFLTVTSPLLGSGISPGSRTRGRRRA